MSDANLPQSNGNLDDDLSGRGRPPLTPAAIDEGGMPDFDEYARRRERLRRELVRYTTVFEDAPDNASSTLFNQAYEAVDGASAFPELAREAFELVYASRNFTLNNGIIDRWLAMVRNLHKVLTIDTDAISPDEKVNMLSQVSTERGKLTSYLQNNRARAYRRFRGAKNYAGRLQLPYRLILTEIEELAASYIDLEPATAMRQAEDLLQAARDHRDVFLKMRANAVLADICQQYHRYYKALYHGSVAYALAKMLSLYGYMAISSMYMMPALMEVGRVNQVRHLLRETKENLQRYGNQRDLAIYSSIAARLHFRNGDLPQAERLYRQAYKYFEQIKDKHNQGIVSTALGMTLVLQQKNWDEADEWFKNSVALFKRLGNETEQIRAQHCIGWNARKQGAFEDARQILKDVLARAEKLPPSPRRASFINNIQDDLDQLPPPTSS
jgi:tetratricopeptide (TPR) repeat protein